MPRITATHWGDGKGGMPTVAWNQAPSATVAQRAFDRILLIEALDRPAAEAALRAAKEATGLAGLAADLGAIRARRR